MIALRKPVFKERKAWLGAYRDQPEEFEIMLLKERVELRLRQQIKSSLRVRLARLERP